jgi:hypothetical protein
MKILLLQDKSYFDELGVDLSGLDVVYGLKFVFSVKKYLKNFDLVISCLDHDELAYKTICLANFLGIPTAYLADGIYDVTNSLHNHMLMKVGRTQLVPSAYSTIFCVGSGFKDWYKKVNANVKIYEYLPRRAALNLGGSKFDAEKLFLITTALTPYFDDNDFDSVVMSLKKVIYELSFYDLKYKFRIFDQRILDCIPEISDNNYIDSSFQSTLLDVGCVISTTSSVLFSCHAYGIPTVVLNHRNDDLLYDVDYVVNKGEDVSGLELLSILKRELKVKKPIVGISISEFKYKTCDGLVKDDSDFFCLGISYYLRSLYRNMPPAIKKKLKVILS